MRRGQITQGDRGFTIVEVAIALAIAGIVAMLAVPSFLSVMPRLQLGSNAITLANGIALARTSAVAKSREYRVVFNPGDDSYSLQSLTGGAFKTFATSTTSRNVQLTAARTWDPAPLPNGTETDAATLAIRAVGSIGTPDPLDTLSFVPLDFDQAWRIYLQTADGAHRKRVVVEAPGRIYVERAKGSSWVED